MAAAAILKVAVSLNFILCCQSFLLPLRTPACISHSGFVNHGIDYQTGGVSPRHMGLSLKMVESSSQLERRHVVAGMLLLAMPLESAVSVVAKAPTSSPIVVEGQMRLEVGSEKKLQAVGGRGNATVYLRCVGKGIISKTSLEIDVADFPPAGQPKPGESGGVPFFIAESDLNAKTEKGNVVNREMWGEDDIFVRVDVEGIKDGQMKRILTGIGKAKYVQDANGKGYHQKPLVLLE